MLARMYATVVEGKGRKVAGKLGLSLGWLRDLLWVYV